MDDDFTERLKALKRDLRELTEEVETLRKRKANGDDVDQIVAKVGAIESEMRSKFGSLQSQNGEIQHSLKTLIDSVDQLRTELSHQKREVNNLQETSKGTVWARIPTWSWVFMAIGLFAVLQLGIERWSDIKNMVP